MAVRKYMHINRVDPDIRPEILKTDEVAGKSLSPVAPAAPIPEPKPIPEVEDPHIPASNASLTSSSSVHASSPHYSTAPGAEYEIDPSEIAHEKIMKELRNLIETFNKIPESNFAAKERFKNRIESLALLTIDNETNIYHLEALGKLFPSEEITTYTDLMNRIQGSIVDGTLNQESLNSLILNLENQASQIPDKASDNVGEAFRTKLKNTVEDLAKLSSNPEFHVSDLIKLKTHYDPLATKLGLPVIEIDMATDHDAEFAKLIQEQLDEDEAHRLDGRP
jgi:hypothetical protein